MAKTKIDYGNTDKWKPHFWYVTPIHGEDFSKKDIPTAWSIQTLDLNGLKGDMVIIIHLLSMSIDIFNNGLSFRVAIL